MGRDAEVHHLDAAGLRQKDVVALDVPVHTVVLVQIQQRLPGSGEGETSDIAPGADIVGFDIVRQHWRGWYWY